MSPAPRKAEMALNIVSSVIRLYEQFGWLSATSEPKNHANGTDILAAMLKRVSKPVSTRTAARQNIYIAQSI